MSTRLLLYRGDASGHGYGVKDVTLSRPGRSRSAVTAVTSTPVHCSAWAAYVVYNSAA